MWSDTHTACAILCGGQGSRLGGVDKGSLPRDSSTFLSHLTRIGFTLTSEVMWVRPQAKSPSHQALKSSDLPSDESASSDLDRSQFQSVRHVPDLIDVKGVLGAVGAALQATRRPWIWILACDMPLLQTHHLLGLIARARVAHEQTRCVAYLDTHAQKVQPLCALWRSDQTSHLVETLSVGGGGLSAYTRTYGEVILSTSSQHDDTQRSPQAMSPFFNVNLPEDLARVPSLLTQQNQTKI
jgi:molybdopterin-guanine dinucleotide biosynthesis protein A